MQFVSVNVVFHERQCAVKFLRCIFSKLLGCKTEQFLFYGRIKVSFVRLFLVIFEIALSIGDAPLGILIDVLAF